MDSLKDELQLFDELFEEAGNLRNLIIDLELTINGYDDNEPENTELMIMAREAMQKMASAARALDYLAELVGYEYEM